MGISEDLILHETYAKKWGIDFSNNHKKKLLKIIQIFLMIQLRDLAPLK